MTSRVVFVDVVVVVIVVHAWLCCCCYQDNDDDGLRFRHDVATDDDDVSDDADDVSPHHGVSLTFTSQESSDAQFSVTSQNKSSISEESSAEEANQTQGSPVAKRPIVDEEDGVAMETKTISDCVTTDNRASPTNQHQDGRVTSSGSKQVLTQRAGSVTKVRCCVVFVAVIICRHTVKSMKISSSSTHTQDHCKILHITYSYSTHIPRNFLKLPIHTKVSTYFFVTALDRHRPLHVTTRCCWRK